MTERPWVVLSKPKPAKVDDHYLYWSDPPPAPSKRCEYWLNEIKRGWRPNRRWRAEGYDASAELYGVYIWEYLNRILPAVLEPPEDAITAHADAG